MSLHEILLCRDQRANLQERYRNEYKLPVISFCMNIPGPIKTTIEIRKLYEEGYCEILNTLSRNGLRVMAESTLHEKTGDESELSIEGSSQNIKELMMNIENSHPLGRLFDIDVIDENGVKVARPHFRTCLICSEEAKACACSRRHSVSEMQKKIDRMLSEYFY